MLSRMTAVGPYVAPGLSVPRRSTDTQAAAIDQARSIARHQRTELLIHGTDGRIRERELPRQ